MIFADKLIQLRKKSGWSQEELAEQMNVTRQSVSKWEGAQSIPDLDKIIRLSELFGVSTDYLLKDELEESGPVEVMEDAVSLKRVSMEEATSFLVAKETVSKPIAYAVFLCIISPVALLILGALSEMSEFGISENMAGGMGLIVLLFLVAAAVAVFIWSGSKTAPFEYFEKEIFETEYGVTGMVKERKEQYHDTYTKYTITGVCLCILAFIPFFGAMIIEEDDELMLVIMLCIALVIVGAGVVLLVQAGVIWGSFEQLLQEGDYSKKIKAKSPVVSAIATVYWLATTAIYLAYSLSTNKWGTSWIIWVVAGVIYPAVIVLVKLFNKKK